jgi:hypothetical protein
LPPPPLLPPPPSPPPMQSPPPPQVTSIACGWEHALLLSDGPRQLLARKNETLNPLQEKCFHGVAVLKDSSVSPTVCLFPLPATYPSARTLLSASRQVCSCCCCVYLFHNFHHFRIPTLSRRKLGRFVVGVGQRLRRKAGHWQTDGDGYTWPCGLF